MRSLLDRIAKTEVGSQDIAQNTAPHTAEDSPVKVVRDRRETSDAVPSNPVSLPSDPVAIAMMHPDHSGLVRKRASEVRHGDRAADL